MRIEKVLPFSAKIDKDMFDRIYGIDEIIWTSQKPGQIVYSVSELQREIQQM